MVSKELNEIEKQLDSKSCVLFKHKSKVSKEINEIEKKCYSKFDFYEV